MWAAMGSDSALARRLATAESSPLWRVGGDRLDQGGWAFLADVTTVSGVGLVAIDRIETKVRVFAPDGTHLFTFLRPGEGPLELRSPFGVEAVPPDSVLVYSSAAAVVVPLGVNGVAGDGRRLIFPNGALDVCVSGESFFARVSAPDQEGIVEKWSRDGVVLARFGRRVAHPDPLVASRLSMGMVECGRRAPWVVTANWDEGTLQGFTDSGDSLWTTRIAEFRGPSVSSTEADGRPGFRVSMDEPTDLCFRSSTFWTGRCSCRWHVSVSRRKCVGGRCGRSIASIRFC
ncbi:MAG: hypothetical protein D6701_00945 [Gemmatimonadetes bacterium]|nr:MAG: hypothetical protein D6701_00945 [Gemmatimonadota bacterium]